MHLQAGEIEDQTVVVNRHGDELTDGGVDGHFDGRAHSEQIEIACGSVLLADPDREQHRALQDELVSQSRPGGSFHIRLAACRGRHQFFVILMLLMNI